jgi:murein DD-endopeptidase MepM/ murein hydrolase activator NlpD
MIKKLLVFSLVAVLVLFPSPVRAQSEFPTYIIQPGDSLGGIAEQFGISLNELISLNGISNPDSISPGQILKIPGLGEISGVLSFHSMQLFEDLRDILISNQLTPIWLIQSNHLESPTQVYTGTELLVLSPENAKVIQPVTTYDSERTLLEVVAELSINPSTIFLVNRKTNSSSFLPGEKVFSVQTTTAGSDQNGLEEIPQISISPLPMVQGSTEVIEILSDTITEITGQLDGHTLNFLEVNPGQFSAIQGIHAMAPPGLTAFSLELKYSDGTETNVSDEVLLKPGDFDYEELTVDPSLIDPTITEPENDFVDNLVSVFTPQKYWEGIFQSPAVYQYYNSLFGTRRTYNGSGIVTFHSGIDFGGGITLPIYAPAPGKVVFAGPLTVRGNTVFIDHGMGIYSGFFHQNKLIVKTGDFVKMGQQIGEVGNTGRIDGTDSYYGAGAHLHWEIWANGVQVDPLPWLINEYP